MQYKEVIGYLRRKAAQFRELGTAYNTPHSAKMMELAEALEVHAAELEKRGTSVVYRLFFCDATDGIVGRKDFDAEDDLAAKAIAETLCNACSDVSDSFELWHGDRLIVARSRRSPKVSATILRRRTGPR